MEILFEDAHIVVCVKPRGVLSQPHEREENMPALLGGKVYPVHRLDRAVGGVMVYAKTKAAAAKLCRAVQEGELKKTYTAVLAGVPERDEGELRDFLYHDARQNKTFVVGGARRGAKEAVLRYRVLGKTEQNGVDFCRVGIELLTGRTHQIRVQFGSRGHALVGDGKYGSRQKAAYPALYATALSFRHPVSQKLLEFVAPLPKDFPWSLFGVSQYEIERKFLIAYPNVAALRTMPGCRVRRILQTYLIAPAGQTHRVRKIEEGDSTRYVETTKRRVSDLRALEEERDISLQDYEVLLRQADPALRPICKTRYATPYGAHTLEVDVYDFWQDRATLEVELRDESEAPELPPFLSVLREVSDDQRYKNVNLARELPRD